MIFDRLERALAAFDMFVIHEEEEDMDEIQQLLDRFAAQFRRGQPSFDSMTPRQKALALLRWIRAQNLTGMTDPETNYRNIRNCLLGQALADPEHPSLPIISAAIYCSLAGRIGLDASCCAFPTHVHTAVTAPAGMTLDGKPSALPPADEADKMYLDPYGSSDEVGVAELRVRLVEMGWRSENGQFFLSASPTAAIVQRTASNLKASWSRARELLLAPGSVAAADELKRLRSGDPELNLEAVLYGAMWAGLLVTPASSLHWDEILESFLPRFVQNFSEDAWIVERWLMPLYDHFVRNHPRGRHRFGWQDARATLGILHNLDARAPTVNRRYTQDICAKVRYRIGQAFRHRRYGYVGIINGWAPDDTNGLPTPHNISVHETVDASGSDSESGTPGTPAPREKRQTYYTCLWVFLLSPFPLSPFPVSPPPLPSSSRRQAPPHGVSRSWPTDTARQKIRRRPPRRIAGQHRDHHGCLLDPRHAVLPRRQVLQALRPRHVLVRLQHPGVLPGRLGCPPGSGGTTSAPECRWWWWWWW